MNDKEEEMMEEVKVVSDSGPSDDVIQDDRDESDDDEVNLGVASSSGGDKEVDLSDGSGNHNADDDLNQNDSEFKQKN